MAREKLNRWGEPEETEPTLHVDEWFPSEKTHQSEGMEQLSRAYVPVGIALGLILGLVSVGVLSYAFRDGQTDAVGVIVGGALGAWSLTFLVPVAFAVTIPAQSLTGRLDAATVLVTLALAVAFSAAARWFWRFGLQRYTGASA